MIDMSKGEAELYLHKFKTHLGSVSREIQNRRLKEMSKLTAEERYSIEYRKKVAAKYGIEEQEVIDMPKKEYDAFISGLYIGQKYGAAKLAADLRKQMEANEAEKNEQQ